MLYGDVPGVGKPVSRLLLGTMIISTGEQERSFALLDAAFERGWNALDCAHVYGGGASERAIGQWMEARGNRERMVILTKGAHPNADRQRVTPYDITSDLEDSLARLRTSYIDIYVLHRDNPALPVGPIGEILNEHHRAGKIRAFGGSNWTHQRIQEANDYAQAHGLVPFTASSPHFSLAETVESPWGPGCVAVSGPRECEARAWYARTGMPLFAYSSLARGLFSGRVTRENYREAADSACQRAYCHEVNFRRLDRVRELAERKGLTVPQVALAYVLSQPLNIFALTGAASVEEIQECTDAVDVKLSPEELAWLNLESDALPVSSKV